MIFLDVDGYTCRERLVSRRYNVITGSEHNLTSSSTDEILVSGALGIHPRDYRSIVEKNVMYHIYNKNVEKKYSSKFVLR